MILDIDLGNTRLKWRLSDGLTIISKGDEQSHLQEMLANLLLKIKNLKIKRIRLAHVLGGEREKEITNFFYKNLNIPVECASVENYRGTIVNQYYKPEQLGIDRWLAVLAAFNHARSQCCIIDCGSAITVDFVSDGNIYLGGYIVPGLQFLAKSLAENTKQLPEIEQYKNAKLQYGRSTIEAIQNGILLMAVSFLERSIKDFSEGKSIPVYLTGGDATILSSYLKLPTIQINIVPSLVLDGLSIALP
jgi:type III pantothenate kinase